MALDSVGGGGPYDAQGGPPIPAFALRSDGGAALDTTTGFDSMLKVTNHLAALHTVCNKLGRSAPDGPSNQSASLRREQYIQMVFT